LPGQDFQQGEWTYRIEEQPGGSWMLLSPTCPVGAEQYSFTLAPQLPVDYEPPNHYSATHPDSRFVQTLTVQLPSFERRVFLRNRELITVTRDESTTAVLSDDREFVTALEKHFGIRLSEEANLALIRRIEAFQALAAKG
jgi:N-hydroxyarylamine O-acetyltransferase